MNTKKWFNRFQEAHGHQPWALITGGSSGMGLEYARQLEELVKTGCAAAVYTQTTDVEGEVNGLVTYDRKVVKLDPERVRAANRRVIETQQ